MKLLFFFPIICLFFSCKNEKEIPKTPKQKIDWQQFENDLKFVNQITHLPIDNGVFPVYEYESSGNGNIESQLTICGNTYILQSVFVYQGDYNTSFFNNVKDPDEEMIFFSVLIKTSIQDTTNELMSTSRNHPTYLAQGVITAEKKRKITWLASHNNTLLNDFAIVNMKHFDLSQGRVVVVFPQNDGSLRFKQLKIKQKSIEELEKELKQANWCSKLDG